MYKIIEVFLDSADKYRVRVSISESETIFFKFDHYPTQEEVNTVAENYVRSQNSNNLDI